MKSVTSLHKFLFSFLFFLSTVTVLQIVSTQQTFASVHYIWHPAGVNTNWSNPNNWRISTYGGTISANAPLAADTAEVGPNNSNFTVVLDVDTTVAVLIISGTGQIFLNTSTSKTLKVTGDIIASNTNGTGGGSCTIKMKNGGNASLIGNTTSTNKGKLPNLIIDKSGSTVTLSNYITMGGSTTLTLTNGTVDATTNNNTIAFYNNNTISGSFTFYDVEFIGSSNTVSVSSNQTVTHDVLITGSSAVTLNSSQIDVQGNITITNTSTSGGGTTVLNLTAANNQTVSASGTRGQGFLPAVKLSKSSGTVTLSGNINVSGNWTNNYSADTSVILSGTSEVYFYKTSTIGGSYKTPLYKATMGTTGGSMTVTLTRDSALIVKNTFTTIGNTNLTINGYSILTKGNIQIDNTYGQSGGTSEFIMGGGANQTFTSSVGLGIGSIPSLRIQKSGGTVTFSGIINIARDWTNNYSADTTVLLFGTSQIFLSFFGGVTHAVGGSYTTSFYDLTVGYGGANHSYNFSKDTAIIVRHLFKTIGGSLNVTMNNYSILVLGNIQIDNAGTQGGGTTELIIGGGKNQTITSSVVVNAGLLPKVKIQKSAGTLSLVGSISVGGNWTNNYSSSPSVILYGTSSVYFRGLTVGGSYSTPFNKVVSGFNNSLNLTMGIDSAMIVNDTLLFIGTSAVDLTGNCFVVKGAIVNNNSHSSTKISSTLYLKGGSTQYLGGSYDMKVTNLKVNKSAGTFTLNKNLTVTGSVTLTNGNIVSTSSSLLIFNDNATVTGASNTSFVSGPVKKIGNDGFKYPLGGGGLYRPDSISAPSTTSDAFISEYVDSLSNSSTLDGVLTKIDPCEHWRLNHSAGSATVNVKLFWNSPCLFIPNVSYLKVAYLNSSTWTSAGTCTTTGNTTAGTIVTSSARSTWTDITLAKTNPLVVANAGRDTGLCYGQSVTLGGAPTGSGGTTSLSYSWSPSTGLSSATATNPVATPTETTTYIVTVTDVISEYSTDTVEVIVNPSFTVDAGSDQTICLGEEVVLGNANVAEGGTPLYAFYWYNPDTVYSREMNVDYYPADSDTFILVVMDSAHCYARDTALIHVHPALSVTAFTDTIIPFKGSIILGGSPTFTGGTSPYFIKWEPSDFLDDTTLANPTITDLINTVVYNLYVSDTFGCYATVNVNVHPNFPEADSSMQFSLLSGGNITVTDSSHVFEKVGAYGSISGALICSDSVWDRNPRVVAGALEDLDSLMDKIDAFALKDTVVSDLASSGVRTTGIYYVKDSAVIDGDWTVTGDASSMYIVCIQDSLIIKSHAKIILDGISPSQLIVFANKTISSYGFSDLNGIFISKGNVNLDTVACPAAFRSLSDINLNVLSLNALSEISGRPLSRSTLIPILTSTTCNLDQDGNNIMDYWGITMENYSAAVATNEFGGLSLGGFNNPMLIRKMNKMHPGRVEVFFDESWDWNYEWFFDERWQLYASQTPTQINRSDLPQFLSPIEQQSRPDFVHNSFNDIKFSLNGLNANTGLVFNLFAYNKEYNFSMLKKGLNLGFANEYVVLGNEPYGQGNHQSFVYPNAKRYLKRANQYLDDLHQDYPGTKVGVFGGADMDHLLSGEPFLIGGKCKGSTWTSQLGLPDLSSDPYDYGNDTDPLLRLQPGDGLVFHVSPTSKLTDGSGVYFTGTSGPNTGTSGVPFDANIPNPDQIPDYFARAFLTKEIFSEEALKTLPAGIEAWITAYTNREQDIAISGTWAHGLFSALMTLQYMEDSRITRLNFFTLLGGYESGFFFLQDNGFTGGLTPDPTIPSLHWGLTSMGLAMSQISEAMHNATDAIKYNLSPAAPSLVGYPDFPSVDGWKFTGNGEEQAIFINVSAVSVDIRNPLYASTGKWIYEQISPPPYPDPTFPAASPLCYIRGNEETAYRIFNLGTWTTFYTGDGNPFYLIPKMIHTTTTFTNLNNPTQIITLPAYSITRVQKLHSSVNAENTSVTIASTGNVMVPGASIVNHSVRLMGEGAAAYKWQCPAGSISNSFGMPGLFSTTNLNGSSIIVSPTVTSTYTLTGYDNNIFTGTMIGAPVNVVVKRLILLRHIRFQSMVVVSAEH